MNARRLSRGNFFGFKKRRFLCRYLLVVKTISYVKRPESAAETKRKGESKMEKKSGNTLTTAFGIPIGDDQNSMTAGARADRS